ncbi:MAG: hypothetical protein RXO23_00985 [Vulcanisaeta sp.]
MSRPKKSRGTKRRRGRFFYLALALVIFGEAAFIAVLFLPGMLSKLGVTQQAPRPNATVIATYMLATLINPYNMSFINSTALGLINNTRPIIMYLTIDDPYLINQACNVWPVLYNATVYHDYEVVVVVFPEPITQAPATASTVQQFNGYVYELCGFNIQSTNFLITTALWGNFTGASMPIVGYGTLLPNLLTDLGINASNVYFPVLILIKPHNTVSASGVVYGVRLSNSTYLNEVLFGDQ